ncbi:MAG: hypothetical protein ACRDJO_06885 [Actinomycetota bacterium]
MKKHILRSVGCLVALITLSWTWTGAPEPVEAARGSATNVVTAGFIHSRQVPCAPGSGAVLCTTGTFTGDLEGPFTFAVDTVAPSGVEGFSLMTGSLVARTNEGDLFLEGTAVANLLSGRFVGLVRVTGGSGGWAGSSGEIRWWSGPTADGGREGEYSGVISVR